MLLEDKLQNFKLIAAQHKIHAAQNLEVFTSPEEGYRMRSEFSIYRYTHAEVPKNQCPVQHVMFAPKTKTRIFLNNQFAIANKLINELMPQVAKFIEENYPFGKHPFQVEYLTSLTNQATISFIFRRALDLEQDQLLAERLKHFLQQNNSHLNKLNIICRAKKQQIIIGDNYITEEFIVANQKYLLLQVENSFSQPNALINQEMLNYVVNYLKHNSTTQKPDILELYCGVGNFTMALARHARNVLATEVNKQAVDFVYKNIALNNLKNIQVGRVSAEELVQALKKVRPFNRLAHLDLDSYEFGTVFVDPPRSGLDNASLDILSNYQQIIYVSCNPETLMPNLQYLQEKHQYKIQQMALFDQFPQTPHLETIAILSKHV